MNTEQHFDRAQATAQIRIGHVISSQSHLANPQTGPVQTDKERLDRCCAEILLLCEKRTQDQVKIEKQDQCIELLVSTVSTLREELNSLKASLAVKNQREEEMMRTFLYIREQVDFHFGSDSMTKLVNSSKNFWKNVEQMRTGAIQNVPTTRETSLCEQPPVLIREEQQVPGPSHQTVPAPRKRPPPARHPLVVSPQAHHVDSQPPNVSPQNAHQTPLEHFTQDGQEQLLRHYLHQIPQNQDTQMSAPVFFNQPSQIQLTSFQPQQQQFNYQNVPVQNTVVPPNLSPFDYHSLLLQQHLVQSQTLPSSATIPMQPFNLAPQLPGSPGL